MCCSSLDGLRARAHLKAAAFQSVQWVISGVEGYAAVYKLLSFV